MMAAAAFAALVALAQFSTAHGFAVSCRPLIQERLDPIISPGKMSGHVHDIMGASKFGPDATYSSIRSSSCNSCTLRGVDNSNYWTPSLYYKNKTTNKYQIVQSDGANVYYDVPKYSVIDPTVLMNVKPFPPGFKMVWGDATRRTPPADDDQTVTWNCKDINGAPMHLYNKSFPLTTKCPGGWVLRIAMPACWDGKNLDSPDHKSHMAQHTNKWSYTIPKNGCPLTHPVRLPNIFLSQAYRVQAFPWSVGQPNPFVLANGDTTGYSGHGDFLNGWDIPTLTTAISTCNTMKLTDHPNSGNCPILAAAFHEIGQAASSCKPDPNTRAPQETITQVFTLPGAGPAPPPPPVAPPNPPPLPPHMCYC